ncbi:Uncharacterised protein [BD1-7 clade bacterium]|uniref:Phage tail protein I n=1 Tax=BD1-7 clade bacterium TaxID=2029982 RepID=A0A5S9Q3G5_9GAMM|nr:Uncharacterised protein [BD1-7 clade bacterium]CAA0111784.1 Uncharacterised protein [BD1-7 clade bacterium]
MTDSLLPPNATQLERDLETVLASASDLPVPIRDLWDPWNCPEHMLPWLAWAVSVDEWDSDWPTEIKRQVCDSSVEVHKRKGTVDAVERALASLDAIVEMEPGDVPHSFRLTAYAQSNLDKNGNTLLTPKLIEQLSRVINRAKNVRSQYELTVGVGFTHHLQTALVMGRPLAIQRISMRCV